MTRCIDSCGVTCNAATPILDWSNSKSRSGGWCQVEIRRYGMSKDIAKIFLQRFNESNLGGIPEVWNVWTVGQNLVELIFEPQPSGDGVKSRPPIIEMENGSEKRHYDFSPKKHVRVNFFDKLKNIGADVRNGDLHLENSDTRIGWIIHSDSQFSHLRCAGFKHADMLCLRCGQPRNFFSCGWASTG